MGVSPFLYTNIQHISAKSKCPPSGLEISLFLIFYTWQPLAQNSEKIAHTHRNPQNLRHMLLRKSAPSAWDNYTPYGSVFSVDVWKNLTQRRKGREALRTFVLMSKILHADNAEPRRRFAELCAFAWEENMSFCSYVKKNISHRTHGIHRIFASQLYLFFCQQIKQHRMTQNFVFDRSIELVPPKWEQK